MAMTAKWSEAKASFPGFKRGKLPELEEIESLFVDFNYEKWPRDASVGFYNSKDDAVALTIIVTEPYGVWLQYDKIKDGQQANMFSLCNWNDLDEYVPIVENAMTLRGMYISPDKACIDVKHFILTEGELSNQIEWISEHDIPEGKHWLVASDCL
jgi:hypothetical protein